MDQELLEIVFDNVYNGIYIVDGRGITLAVNRTFEEMSGIRGEELVGRSLYELVGKDNYFTGSASLLVIERKAPVTATYSTSTGRKLLVKGRPIFDGRGEIRYIVNTIWDLTVVQYQQTIDDDTARDHLVAEEDLIACSDAMRQVIDVALRVAPSDSTLLITGETGVGKSLLARLIHRASSRREKPLMQINCAAIPEALLESELFGYEAGAFTGADRKGKPGLFELADSGTVFLDEIAEIPLHTQAKLLGVLQDREYYRIGGRKITSIDVRLIAATNRDLARLVAEGRFRADLFYRLDVVPLQIPPLRDRRDDIPALIDFFLAKHNRRHQTYRIFSRKTMDYLTSLPWPGNIRELENAVERLVVTAGDDADGTVPAAEEPMVNSAGSLKMQLQEYERKVLLQARRRYGSTRRMATALGISQASTVRKLQRLAPADDTNGV
ncbi:MAG: sigma 54-interacting transcriptional regulator [Desulfuromonadales bacterium]|nr:sigma 54-interacting transcriptional regulator [Desulfuromonadales bacterium]